MDVDIIKGIDELLFHNNINILCLLLREGCVMTEFIVERAKKIYAVQDEIFVTHVIDFFCDEMIVYDQELAQICLELLFRSTGNNCHAFKILPINTVKKLMTFGATIPSKAKYLSKLPYDDFVEQIELTGEKLISN